MTQSATERSFKILELLVEHPGSMALGDISLALDIPKSIVHRLLGLLAAHGDVKQDEATGEYGLTLKIALLGARQLALSGLTDISQPILDRLAAMTGELVRLAVVENEGLVWVAKAQGARHGLRYDPDTGMHVVLHATATGKAWLASMPEERAMRIVVATGFETPLQFGPKVIRDPERFRDELRRTRERGYGVAVEEGEPGTAAVAVLVRGGPKDGDPAVGTLSVAGPVARLPGERREELADKLRGAAAELSALWPIRRSFTQRSVTVPGHATMELADVR